ncbi:MAG: glycosyltransferase [Bacteroidota bacterium]|nr:glycosyltransferase [Bacteroidota bacterium]
MQKPVISILCTTYNHASFIKDALESFLAQRVSVPIEIIVHDDASTDGTQEIIQQYQQKYPELIRAILQQENQYRLGKGRVIRNLYSAASGNYLALCEGDDHWIDPDKLQKQLDALEADPLAIGCFTDAYNQIRDQRSRFMGGYASAPTGSVDQKTIIRGQGIPTCTVMFRKIDLSSFYEIIKQTPVVDTILFTYLTNYGYLLYLPFISGVRVIHAGGMYSMQSAVRKLDMYLRTLPFMDQLSDHKYSSELIERRRKLLNIAWSESITTNNQELAKYVWPLIQKERKLYGWNFTTTMRNFFKAYWPLPDRIYGRLTGK